MPRYYIDTDDDDLLVESDGSEMLTSPAEARRAALDALPDMARDKMPDGDHRTFRATVRDEHGREVYTATMTLVGTWKITPPAS
ncbi:DUF6894 family protein [Methylobacterium trifolii]|uniref:DUF6894 domain-containing protein n=1 Tax=Methylobacterium trifolii TaxID=1003092 RepID=A0ABQ4U3Y3_9HYPH|nr:hypothetical protein [Methylobacterium trifolii]GJE61847.1 hypothetical protein MPOCJGCO_3973 [Methylobacterium trifolii]